MDRILVAEDDAALRLLYTVWLESAGFDVTPVADGRAALEALERRPLPDAALLDIEMPFVDGLSVCRYLHALDPAVRIVVVTGMEDARGAALTAEADSGVDVAAAPDRVGASIATAQGGVASLADCCAGADAARIHPRLVTAFMPNMAAGWVSMELGVRGPVGAPCTACAASAMAIGEGYDAIRLGRADVMFCGGSQAGITPPAIAGFAAMRAPSRRHDDPARASRPFDADRDGFVMW